MKRLKFILRLEGYGLKYATLSLIADYWQIVIEMEKYVLSTVT